MSSDKLRTADEIRRELRQNRAKIDADLSELGERLSVELNPRHFVASHPILVTMAGAAIGVVIYKRPDRFVREALKFAKPWIPLLGRLAAQRFLRDGS